MLKTLFKKSLIQKSLAFLASLHDRSLVRLLPYIEKLPPQGLWSNRVSLVGVAIGNQEIQLLSLEKYDGIYIISHYACVVMPLGTIVEGKIKSSKKIVELLKQAIELSACSQKQVAIALPNLHVITKKINLRAGLSEFELSAEVEFAAPNNLPLSMENVSLDYHALGLSEDNPEEMEILLVASLNAPIQERLQIVEEAGLEAKVVDVESYVLHRSLQFCFSQLPPNTSTDLVVLFDFHEDSLSFIAAHQGVLVYHQEDLFVSDEFSHIVVEHYQLGSSISTYQEWAALVPADYLVELFPQIQALLLKRILHCFQLFASSLFFKKVDCVFLSGDLALVPDVTEWLSKELEMQVVIANPLQNVHFAAGINQEAIKQQAHRLMRVIGLALRGGI